MAEKAAVFVVAPLDLAAYVELAGATAENGADFGSAHYVVGHYQWGLQAA